MIIYNKLWVTMKKKGISTYRLRESHGFNTNLVDFVRENTGDADSPFGKIRVERAEKPGFLRTAYKGFALLLLFYCAIIK